MLISARKGGQLTSIALGRARPDRFHHVADIAAQALAEGRIDGAERVGPAGEAGCTARHDGRHAPRV